MKFINLPFKIKIIQLFFKLKRKIGSVLHNKALNREVYLLSFDQNWFFNVIKDADFMVTYSKPPAESYMFFPLGKGPDLSESICFSIVKEKKICAWAWLHKGVRKDIVESYGIDLADNVLWFGPDYVNPCYRGNSMQKILIQERLSFVKDNFEEGIEIWTLIGSSNIPSLKSYNDCNFEIKQSC